MLTTEELLTCMSEGQEQALTPHSLTQAQATRIIQRIRDERVSLNQDDPKLHALASIVEEPLKIVKSEVREKLARAEMYLLPYPVCSAYIRKFDSRTVMVIGSGLIDLIETTSYATQVLGFLPPECDEIEPLEELPGYSLSNIMDQFCFLLLHGYSHRGAPLPNFLALCDQEMIQRARISFAGGLAFALLHELGHIELNHLDSKNTRISEARTTITEELSLRQRQEIEADEFALNSFEDEFSEIGQFFLKSAFDFFVKSEVITGEFSAQHPLTINRIYHLNSHYKAGHGYHDPVQSAKHYETLSEKFLEATSNSTNQKSEFLDISSETARAILSLVHDQLRELSLDITPLLSAEPAPSWEQNLISFGMPWHA